MYAGRATALTDFQRKTVLSAEESGLMFEDLYSERKLEQGPFSFTDAGGLW